MNDRPPSAPRSMVDIAVDVVGAGVGVVAAAVGFGAVHGGHRWLVVVVIGTVLALSVATLCRLRRWSALPTSLTAIVLFVCSAAASVPGEAPGGVLPAPSAVGALLDGAARGPARILTTAAPVGEADGMLAVAHLVCFVAAFVAVTLALGTRSPWAPVLPFPVVVVIAALLGTGRGPEPALIVLLAALVPAWIGHRARRSHRRIALPGEATLRTRVTAGVFLLVVTVVGVLVAPVLPLADGRERLVPRERLEPPFDPRSHPSPLAAHRSWRHRARPDGRLEPDATPVLTATGLPEGVPLVLAALDLHDGAVWHVGRPRPDGDGGGDDGGDGGGEEVDGDPTGSARFERVGTDLGAVIPRGLGAAGPTSEVATEEIEVRIVNHGVDGPWLPLPPGATSIEPRGARATSARRQLRYNAVTGTAVLTGGFRPGDELVVTALVPEHASGDGAARSRAVGDRPADPSVVLPPIPDDDPILATEATRLAVGATDLERAEALEAALRAPGIAYRSDGFDDARDFTAGHSLGKLREFLTETDGEASILVGDAERFAAAMAVLARDAGLPARVVVGFREDADDEHPAQRSGDVVEFGADHFDAWVEIAFEDRGWVAFHPTPPRSNGEPPPPASTEPQPTEVEIQARPPITPPPDVDQPTTRQAERDEDLVEEIDGDGWALPVWALIVVRTAGSILVLLAIVGFGILGVKALRRRRRRHGGDAVARLDGAWRESLDQLRDAGHRTPLGGTRRHTAASLPPQHRNIAAGFADRIDAAMFGPDEPADGVVAALWGEVDALRARLLDGLGPIARMRVALNPVTLRRRRQR